MVIKKLPKDKQVYNFFYCIKLFLIGCIPILDGEKIYNLFYNKGV